MADDIALDRSRSAVLIMDYQAAVVEGFATDQDGLLKRAAQVLGSARAGGLKIIYIVVNFRPGYPEVSPRNVNFNAVRQSGRFITEAGTEVHPAVAPQPGDITVIKHRVGGFPGTDLDMILRANDIETLVMFGIATSGVVLSTLRHAADSDYRLIVLKDCCSDRDAEVHRVLVEKIFPRQAKVITAAEFLSALGA
ncbi:MAG TPA: isochorismatase family cysteine hydrolase [Candidatus Binataceae bacterium]|nr:isochorismatase family cysteine hydrolase [Candidatus Binataceae bacterium]